MGRTHLGKLWNHAASGTCDKCRPTGRNDRSRHIDCGSLRPASIQGRDYLENSAIFHQGVFFRGFPCKVE